MKPEWITAIATLLYMIFTALIILQMQKDRRALHQPILRIWLKDAKYPEWLIFTLKNIGKGPALKCEALCTGEKGIKWKLKDNIKPIGINETIDIRFEPINLETLLNLSLLH